MWFLDATRARVVVWGDVMWDVYWHTDRDPAQHTVAFLKHVSDEGRLGGAANVAANINAWGAKAYLVGCVGQDEAGCALRVALDVQGIQHHMISRHDVCTTEKTRVLASQQPVLRLDHEQPLPPDASAALLAQLRDCLPAYRTVVCSDYHKGACDRFQQLRAHLLPHHRVVVDPKRADFAHYRGCAVLTPNQLEFERAVGHCVDQADCVAKAQTLIQALDLEALVITQGESGMLVVQEAAWAHYPARTRKVYDVTGAGDTVVATLAVALDAGLDVWEAAQVANAAAGIAVSKVGTSVVYPQDMVDEGVLWDPEHTVFVRGEFDTLSPEVLAALQTARAACRRLVAVPSDVALHHTWNERKALLSALRCVDGVVSETCLKAWPQARVIHV